MNKFDVMQRSVPHGDTNQTIKIVMKALHHVISANDYRIFKAATGKSPIGFWDIYLGFDALTFADSVFPGYEDEEKTVNEMLHDLGGEPLVRVVHKLIDGVVSPATRLS